MRIPIPQWEEPEVYIPTAPIRTGNDDRIIKFLDVKPWKCPACRGTNFGRNLFCADWRCKLPRPADFKEEPR
jgi:hypothetical protein